MEEKEEEEGERQQPREKKGVYRLGFQACPGRPTGPLFFSNRAGKLARVSHVRHGSLSPPLVPSKELSPFLTLCDTYPMYGLMVKQRVPRIYFYPL